jgi:hypothetical protein
MQPLRSISITKTSTLLRVAPSLCPASVLSPLWGLHLGFSLTIEATPGRPEESHHQSPTDPYVSFSTHTARVSLSLETSQSQADAESDLAPPHTGLAATSCELTHPLRSNPITEPSPLLQDDPSPLCASILSPFVGLTYKVFP